MGLSQYDEKIAQNYFVYFAGPSLLSHAPIMGQTIAQYRADTILVTTDDTVDHHLTLTINPTMGNRVTFGSFDLPAGSGMSAAVPAVNIFAALPNLPFLVMQAGDDLELSDTVTVTAAKFLYSACLGAYL